MISGDLDVDGMAQVIGPAQRSALPGTACWGCWIVISVFSCQHRQPGSAVQQQNVVIQNIVHRQLALIPHTRQHHEIESSQPGPAPRHCHRQEGDPEETRRLLLEAPEPGRQSGPG